MRLDLARIGDALLEVERDCPRIDAELERLTIGRKAPFTSELRRNMLTAYEYLDELLHLNVEPFSDAGMEDMLVLNHRVHYGRDERIMAQFALAIDATIDKFNTVAYPLRQRGVEAVVARQRAHALLERVGLLEFATRQTGQLSGGQ